MSLTKVNNDLPLSGHCHEIYAQAQKLNYYQREGMVAELDKAIGKILDAGMRAGYRLNDLRYGPVEHPAEPQGG